VDLRTCGTSKVICIGGKEEQNESKEQINDNVSCYIFKDKAISVQEGDRLRSDVYAGRRWPRNPSHRSHFSCLDTQEDMQMNNIYWRIGQNQ